MRLFYIPIQALLVACEAAGVIHWSWGWVMCPTITLLLMFSLVGMFAWHEATKFRVERRNKEKDTF